MACAEKRRPGTLRVRALTWITPAGDLRELDVLRLQALGALGNFEADLLALGEGAEPLGLDGRVVAEDVLATIVLRDETKTLRVIEPLHGAGRHCIFFQCSDGISRPALAHLAR